MAAHVPRVYLPQTLAVGDTLSLPAAKQHHLATVLRLSTGKNLKLFNDSSHEYDACITQASRKSLDIEIVGSSTPARESPLAITLLQSIASGERMDYALAKAVELGVDRIRPVFSDNGKVKLAGNRLAKKHRHWQAVVESAAEQSGRLVCPPVETPDKLSTAVTRRATNALGVILAPDASTPLPAFANHTHVEVLIGPESGLSAREIETARDNGWRGTLIGPRVLRTETAGPAAISVLQTIAGDFATANASD